MISGVVIHKNFLSISECDDILNHAKSNFRIDDRIIYSNWHARINESKEYQSKIYNLIKKISPFDDFHISWINLTEYENGRDLEIHYDERSNYTFTIVLTNNYVGGEFIIQDFNYNLEKGDCISFDGSTLLHGVNPVTSGYRAALNIWIKKGKQNIL